MFVIVNCGYVLMMTWYAIRK